MLAVQEPAGGEPRQAAVRRPGRPSAARRRPARRRWTGSASSAWPSSPTSPPAPCPTASRSCSRCRRVLATEADVLLLDEPASGIDTKWVDTMLDLVEAVREQGRTVCIVEHNLHVGRPPGRPHLLHGARPHHRPGHDRRADQLAATGGGVLWNCLTLSARAAAVANGDGRRAAPRRREPAAPATAASRSSSTSTSHVNEGEIVGILGHNGSGKSTTDQDDPRHPTAAMGGKVDVPRATTSPARGSRSNVKAGHGA